MMHVDQNLVFIIVIAIVGIVRAFSNIAEKARESRARREAQQRPSQQRSGGASVDPDEEKVRKFFEALGQPPATGAPPRVRPRTDIPPRPVAPVAPPLSAPPLIPRRTKRGSFRPVISPPSVAVERAPTAPPTLANAPGAWIAGEQQLERPQLQTVAKRDLPATAAASWRDALRTPATLRNAIILREIFGPPRALHEHVLG
jgi:hypothetical protein